MNLFFLSQIIPYPPHGGVLQRSYNVIKEMSNYFDIYLFAFIHPDILKSYESIEESKSILNKFCVGIEYFDLWPKKSLFNRNLAFFLSLFMQKPFSVLAHRSNHFKKRFDSVLSSQNFDIIHYDTIGLAQYHKINVNCPLVLTHHNIESKLMDRRAKVETNIFFKYFLKLQAIRLKNYEAQISPSFSCNIMMSEIDSDQLKTISPKAKTAVIPNGVDTDYFYPRNGAESQSVIYTGGMNMYANKDAVLYFIHQIWPKIKTIQPDTQFYVIGQDPPIELKNIAKLDPSIVVTGFVDDIRPYVANSAVYIVPLRVGGGTRLKIVDAMAQGKAIVSTSIGCEGIFVQNGKNIIIADDPSSFADEVILLLKDSIKRRKIGNAAREMVCSLYSWKLIGKKMNTIYKKIIDNAG